MASSTTLQKKQLPSRGALTLKIWIDGKPTAYHITIVMLDSHKAEILDNIIYLFGHYIGRRHVFNLHVQSNWGQSSVVTESHNDLSGVNVEDVRKMVFDYIKKHYPEAINITRYPNSNGFPPQHVAVGANAKQLDAWKPGASHVVTYSFS